MGFVKPEIEKKRGGSGVAGIFICSVGIEPACRLSHDEMGGRAIERAGGGAVSDEIAGEVAGGRVILRVDPMIETSLAGGALPRYRLYGC